ncbi:MAG: HAMP domain-containing sensor histidine kinase [Rhodocyclaceae bacterium]
MNLYLRSSPHLLLAGNILAALPFAAVTGYASILYDDMAERSEATAQQAALAGRLERELVEDMAHMEKTLLRFQVLEDESLREDYLVARAQWQNDLRSYSSIALIKDIVPELQAVLREEAAIYEPFREGEADAARMAEALGHLIARTDEVLKRADGIITADHEAFHAEAQNLRWRLGGALAAALAVTVLVLAWSRRLSARLMRRLEDAVGALGEGRLDEPLKLEGPQDVRWIGERLDALRRRLAAGHEQRTTVLRHVSHELKTPLAALREGASLLADGVAGPLNEAQAKVAAILQGNVARLQALIDNLLRLQRAAQAGSRFEPMPVQLDALVRELCDTHRVTASRKGLHILADLKPVSVEGGREELTGIIDNLLANAVKFSPEGASVRLSLARAGGNAVLEVADEGPGIAAADRDRIFEPFYRGAATRAVAGSGLGLAIAAEFVAAHQGHITLIDAPVGAHFRVELPIEWKR